MATYNGEGYLEEQLDSLLRQNPGDGIDYHIYVRDDGSSDTTPAILERYSRRYDNIHIVADEVAHRGCRDGFLYLAGKVDADCYFFSDQDDVWNPDKVATTLRELIKYDDALPAMVHTDLEVVDRNLNTLRPSFFRMTGFNPEYSSSLGYTCAYSTVTGCTVAFNRAARDLLIKAPLTTCLHDRLLSLVVLAGGGTVGCLDKATIKYRQHSGNAVGAVDGHGFVKSLDQWKMSWRRNVRWYRDVRAVTGWGLAAYLMNKIRYIVKRRLG